LIERPDTRLTICGKYNWPAFLHLPASSEPIISEKGRDIAWKLSKDTLPGLCLIVSPSRASACLEVVFQNVLRHGDEALLKQVIDLDRGAAGITILPLLIRANEANILRWILTKDTARTSKPTPILWVLLCNFFQHNPSSESWGIFIRAAEFLVEKAIWDRMVLMCLNSRNLCFVKHFFYPINEILPKEVAEETLRGLSQASTDQSLLRDWADKGFANASLWSAMLSGLWKSPAFETLLSCFNFDLNEPFPRKKNSDTGEANTLSPQFSGNSIGEKQKLPPKTPVGNQLRVPLGPNEPQHHALQDYQMQLRILDQLNKRRLMIAREEQENRRATNGLLGWTMRESPLAWAAANCNVQLVEVLLRSSRVNVNSQDVYNRTPLMHAISVNAWQIVKRLLENEDVDLNVRDERGRTAVFLAAQKDLRMIQLLMETHKVDLSIRDYNGESVQDIARMTFNQDIITALAT
jgi:hypothetical protein